MVQDPEEIRSILEHNAGFDDPALWIDYAQSHGFRRVEAAAVPRCPDCSAAPKRRAWGQYVFYSTLIRLIECERCGLVWANTRIDPEVVRQHFEAAYKDDAYFRVSRKAIFDHLAAAIDRLAPKGARILDVGGARGDLMVGVRERRPDLHATIHDLSKAATDWAASHFGFSTLTGDAHVLAAHREQYDVVVLSDVLYYEPDLPVLWSALDRLIRPGGAIVLRLPNTALLLRLGQLRFESTHGRLERALQDRVRFHNPEHIFLFRRRHLRRRLERLGFGSVAFVPSPLLSARPRAAGPMLFAAASLVHRISGGALTLTPSTVVIGTGRVPRVTRSD